MFADSPGTIMHTVPMYLTFPVILNQVFTMVTQIVYQPTLPALPPMYSTLMPVASSTSWNRSLSPDMIRTRYLAAGSRNQRSITDELDNGIRRGASTGCSVWQVDASDEPARLSTMAQKGGCGCGWGTHPYWRHVSSPFVAAYSTSYAHNM